MSLADRAGIELPKTCSNVSMKASASNVAALSALWNFRICFASEDVRPIRWNSSTSSSWSRPPEPVICQMNETRRKFGVKQKHKQEYKKPSVSIRLNHFRAERARADMSSGHPNSFRNFAGISGSWWPRQEPTHYTCMHACMHTYIHTLHIHTVHIYT